MRVVTHIRHTKPGRRMFGWCGSKMRPRQTAYSSIDVAAYAQLRADDGMYLCARCVVEVNVALSHRLYAGGKTWRCTICELPCRTPARYVSHVVKHDRYTKEILAAVAAGTTFWAPDARGQVPLRLRQAFEPLEAILDMRLEKSGFTATVKPAGEEVVAYLRQNASRPTEEAATRGAEEHGNGQHGQEHDGGDAATPPLAVQTDGAPDVDPHDAG